MTALEEVRKQRLRERNRRQRARMRSFFNKLKDKPCTDCGGSFPPYVMEWDHVSGEKSESVAQLVARGRFAQARAEIEKCELVCSNCHRIRTFGRLGDPETLPPVERLPRRCKDCGASPDEKPFHKERSLCLEHYNARQRDTMRTRRMQ